MFQNNSIFHFESFDTVHDKLESNFPWYPEEEKVINTVIGKEGKPLFFGKLFIEGKEIKGFPPSPKSLKEIFNEHGLTWNPKLYPFKYNSVKRGRWNCKEGDFSFQTYTENLSLDICRICTKHHPYLDEELYCQKEWIEYEKQKYLFLHEKLKENKLFGIVAYYQQNPIGFIESFPLDVSIKLGFPVSELNDSGLMITCLSVRTETSGYGVGSELIRKLEKEAEKNTYKTLEVISFPDNHNWQPVSLYKKQGFKEIKKIGELTLLKKFLL